MTSETARRRFHELVVPWLDDAYRLARWITASPQDAEDVVQEAMLRAFAGLDSLASENARNWLLTIVRRTAYSWLAKNRPTALVLSGDLEQFESTSMQGEINPVATPETILLAAEDERRLARAIEALPMPFRETLVLRDPNGLSYREIAEILDIPIGTVMSRLARARGLLMRALAEDGRP